ncbi:MAG TPA: MarR family transcriptional regulator [Polyangiaceae bacterium]|nr:MarR family transcriptional regulator [Polyangiaceae bacterium]
MPPAFSSVSTETLLKLDNQFCFALHAASRRVVRAYRPVLEELDLTYPQYLVMLVLWEWDHERHSHPTVKALGERLELDSGTLTPLLRRLEDKGLIDRERSQDDERELYVRITRAGRALKQQARRIPISALENAPLPLAEIFALRDQLNRLRAAMAASDVTDAPA